MNNSYLYTETAFHHEGDIEYLKKLILESKEAGAKGVKFQVLTDVKDFVSSYHTGFEELASYCFSFERWDEIFSFTESLDLDIIMMPLNLEALELAKNHKIRFLDIHSVSFNDKELLKAVKKEDIDVILGVGGRKLEEIYDQNNFFGERLKILMVGFQSFPSKIENIKMAKISQLRFLFPEKEIGYADHSSPKDSFCIRSNEYARILGATIFEKHITINGNEKEVDSASACTKDVLKEVLLRLDFIDKHVTDFSRSFEMDSEELVYRNRQLVCVAKKQMEVGSVLQPHDISLKMYHNPEDLFSIPEDIYFRKVKRKIREDEVIRKFHL